MKIIEHHQVYKGPRLKNLCFGIDKYCCNEFRLIHESQYQYDTNKLVIDFTEGNMDDLYPKMSISVKDEKIMSQFCNRIKKETTISWSNWDNILESVDNADENDKNGTTEIKSDKKKKQSFQWESGFSWTKSNNDQQKELNLTWNFE